MNIGTISCVHEDGLISGTRATTIWNVACSSSATLNRGDLICAASPSSVFSIVGGASDASKVLAICAAPNEGSSVTTAYVAGEFNADKITFGGNSALTTTPFEQSLRTQNIHLTALK